MAYSNKTYVAFDGDNDISYYRLMTAWKQNENIKFNFYNAHDLNNARDSSLESSIKRQLTERIKNTKVFVLLIGESTQYLYKFVRWEIEKAIELKLPIICVNLNGIRNKDDERCPPILRAALAVHISFNAKILQYALEYWPNFHQKVQNEGKTGAYYYNEQTYRDLGL